MLNAAVLVGTCIKRQRQRASDRFPCQDGIHPAYNPHTIFGDGGSVQQRLSAAGTIAHSTRVAEATDKLYSLVRSMQNVGDLFRALDAQLNEETKRQTSVLTAMDARVNLHLGLNALIRSLAFYKNGSADGNAYFGRLGMPDDASAVLGIMYWHHLRGEGITKDVVMRIFEENWYISDDDAQDLAESLVEDYARYASH